MNAKPGDRWPEVAIEDALELPDEVARDPQAFTARVLEGVFAYEGQRLALSVYFCGDEEIGRIHGEHLDDPSPTDVISFPFLTTPEDEETGAAEFADGELVVGTEFARASACEHGNNWEAEIALYLVHGCLHLFGYDDHDSADVVAMKRAEREVIARLDYAIEGRFDSHSS